MGTKTSEIKNAAATDLKPKGKHWFRFVAAIALMTVGLADIVRARFFCTPAEAWPKEAIFMVLIGIGIVFTNTIITMVKAFIPSVKK